MAEPVPPSAAQKGQVLKRIAGFELIEKVGQGGMGAVFKARQVSLDRLVALKVLPPSIAKNSEFIERFMREARAAGRLNHPHIVQGIDVGLCEKTGLYYFAMEFVDGPPLGRALKESGAFPEEYVRKVAQQMGDALDYAHQNGIVHRDIKPDNILMNSQGMSKLADLGLAKQLEKQEDASLTQAGIAVGTPFYMAPEQVRGQLDQIDTRTDLYCLGATLFHMVTGRPPYQGATNAVIMASHLTEKVPYAHQVNPQVSEGFSRLLYALMQKERTKRPIDPKVFLEMLERVDEVGGTTRRAARGIRGTTGPRDVVRSTTGPRDRIRPTTGPRDSVSPAAEGEPAAPVRTHTVVYFVVGLVAVALIGGGLLALTMGGKKQEDPPKVAASGEPVQVAPPEPVPVKAPPPKPEWNASGEFENAQRAIERNPNDLRGHYLLYQRLFDEAEREKAPENWMEKFRTARDEAKSKFDQQVAQARSELEQKVKAAKEQHQYDDALQAIADFPSPEDAAERDRLKELGDELRKSAESLLQPLLEEAGTALKEGRLDDAAASLKKTEGIAYLPLNEAIGKLQNQLTEARAEAEQKAAEAAKVAADEGWKKLQDEFDAALLEKGDLEMVRVILKTAREDKKLEPRKEEVSFLGQVGGKVLGYIEQENKALEALKGQKVSWTLDGKTVNGRIKAVKDGTIDLLIALDKVEMVRNVKVSDLSDEDRLKLRPALNPQTPPEALAAALLKLMKGSEDREAAKRFLEGAGESALALRYRDLLRDQVGDATEGVAEKAWRELAAKAEAANLTPAQMEQLRNEMEAFNQTHGKSQFAVDHQKDIAALADKLTPKETGSVTADRVVLWNLHGSGYYLSGGRGTTRADLVLYLKDKPLWQMRDIRVIWKSAESAATEIRLPNIAFDRIRLMATNYTGQGAGLAEIQVFKGPENIALGRATNVSDVVPDGPGAKAVDGQTRTGLYGSDGWVLPDKQKTGWIEIDFSKPARKAGPLVPVAPGAGEEGGPQGNWRTPLGGEVNRGDNGRITLRGPGEGDAGGAIAVYDEPAEENMDVQGHFRRRGPFAGLIVGYDEPTQRFISFYSSEDKGVDMYVYTGKERKLLTRLPDIVVREAWVPFSIKQRDRDMTITIDGKSHAFKLPEDWPKGRQIGLITHFNSTAQIQGVHITPAEPAAEKPPAKD